MKSPLITYDLKLIKCKKFKYVHHLGKAAEIWQSLFDLYRQHCPITNLHDLLVDFETIRDITTNADAENRFLFGFNKGDTSTLFTFSQNWIEGNPFITAKSCGFDIAFTVEIKDNILTICECGEWETT